MSLSRHVDADALMEAAADHPHVSLVDRPRENRTTHDHGGRYRISKLPKYSLPEDGCTGKEAYEIITNELSLDGSPTLNLASFVHVSMPDEALRLLSERANINLVDQDEYPATMAIHGRCVSMLADVWHAPVEKDEHGHRKAAEGVATTGSSEALMLGGLALKKTWQNKRKAEGKSFKEPGPNLVFGANCQVVSYLIPYLIPTITHYHRDYSALRSYADTLTLSLVKCPSRKKATIALMSKRQLK